MSSSNYDIPNSVVVFVAFVAVLVGLVVATFIHQQYRPYVVAWEGRLIRYSEQRVGSSERPLQVTWEGVVYDCVEAEDQGAQK